MLITGSFRPVFNLYTDWYSFIFIDCCKCLPSFRYFKLCGSVPGANNSASFTGKPGQIKFLPNMRYFKLGGSVPGVIGSKPDNPS